MEHRTSYIFNFKRIISRYGAAILLGVILAVWQAWILYPEATTLSLRVTMRILKNSEQMAQVFFDTGHGYSENESVAVRLTSDGTFHDYQFSFPRKPVFHIRFDPLQDDGNVIIRDLMIIDGLGRIHERFSVSSLKPLYQIESVEYTEKELLISIHSGAEDPQMDLILKQPLFLQSKRIIIWPPQYIIRIFGIFLAGLGLVGVFQLANRKWGLVLLMILGKLKHLLYRKNMAGYIHWKKLAFLIVFIIFHCLIGYNFYLLSKDTINGDSSASKMLVKPRHAFMRVPENNLSKEFNAVNRISADFAQLYFPARISSPMTYTSESPDPWHRQSRYAPFIHLVCHYSLCKLPYGYAGFLNIIIQLLLLYISFVFAFRALHIERYLLSSLLLVNICLFLTPVGLSWFERGQFSIYVTLAYLWLFLGIIGRNPYYLFLSALFAYIKWTSFPFIFVAASLWILNSKSIKELKANICLAIVVPLTISILFLFDVKEGIFFLKGLFEQEKNLQPSGLSLIFLLPRYWVKSLPLILVVLGYLYIWKNKNEFAFLIPYLSAVGILSILYPTLAFDYSTPCLLCFIPLLIYWTERGNIWRGASVGVNIKTPVWYPRMQEHLSRLTIYFFSVFLLVASSFNSIAQFYKMPKQSIIYVYIACAIILMGVNAQQLRQPQNE